MKRREFLKLSAVAGTAAVAGLGLNKLSLAGEPQAFTPMTGNGQELEARIDPKTGSVDPNPNIVMLNSGCLGCYTACGNRVKIDKRTGHITRLFGNPYNPNNTEGNLLVEAPLTDAYLAFSTFKDRGHSARSTLCGRGNATLQAHYDPDRIVVPLKRAGKRGEGKWKPITWEQAVQETVEGGALFADLGENTPIEGFRQVHDVTTPLDPDQPELGPKSNQLAMFGGRWDGRTIFGMRFAGAFGSRNYHTHAYT
ncbi:MAG: twin-arginine translocation signal domain-containing protein [Desulfitobacterium sp.]